jgi:hypothetical protein
VMQRLASQKQPARPAPSSPATPPDVAAWPGERPPRDPSRPLPCPGTLAPPYKYRFPASSPKIRRRPWGFLPVRRKKRGKEGEKEKLGERRTGGHPWENPKSPRRWTTTPLSGLQARPPEEGVSCVAAAKPKQPEPGTLTPKPEPSVVKSPPRNRSRTCWRWRRAALLPL